MTDETTRPPSLAEFFEGMGAFYAGDCDLDTLRSRWGPLPADGGRVGFYRTLVQGNWNRVLDKLYPATKRAVESAAGQDDAHAWSRIKRSYCQSFRPHNWDLNALGQDLRAFFETQADAWPPYVRELADFEWIKYATWRADSRIDLAQQRFNPTAVARHYTHLVHEYAANPELSAPVAAPATLVVFRHPDTHVARVIQPTLVQMLLLGVAQGELEAEVAWAHARQAGITQDEWSAARRLLRRLGLLGVEDR